MAQHVKHCKFKQLKKCLPFYYNIFILILVTRAFHTTRGVTKQVPVAQLRVREYLDEAQNDLKSKILLIYIY